MPTGVCIVIVRTLPSSCRSKFVARVVSDKVRGERGNFLNENCLSMNLAGAVDGHEQQDIWAARQRSSISFRNSTRRVLLRKELLN
jgi:hypothetical protein